MALSSAPSTDDRGKGHPYHYTFALSVLTQAYDLCLRVVELLFGGKRYILFCDLLITRLLLFHLPSSYNTAALHNATPTLHNATLIVSTTTLSVFEPDLTRQVWDPGIGLLGYECTRTATGSVVILADAQSHSVSRYRDDNLSNPVIKCFLYSSSSSTTSRRHSPCAVAEPCCTARPYPF